MKHIILESYVRFDVILGVVFCFSENKTKQKQNAHILK